MSDRPEEEARAAAVETRESPKPADVGSKVNAIIEAAEAAAKEIRQDASKVESSATSCAASGWNPAGRPSGSEKLGMPRSGRPVIMYRRRT